MVSCITIEIQIVFKLLLVLVASQLLASLEERFTYEELDCFFGVEDKELGVLKDDDLVNEAARDIFTSLEPIILSAEEVLSYF